MNEMKSPIKPITLVREEFVESLTALCNDSGLPLFIIESILKDFTQEVYFASRQQYEADKKRYNQELLELQSRCIDEAILEE